MAEASRMKWGGILVALAACPAFAAAPAHISNRGSVVLGSDVVLLGYVQDDGGETPQTYPAYLTLFRRETPESAVRVGRIGETPLKPYRHTAMWRFADSSGPGGAIRRCSRKSGNFSITPFAASSNVTVKPFSEKPDVADEVLHSMTISWLGQLGIDTDIRMSFEESLRLAQSGSPSPTNWATWVAAYGITNCVPPIEVDAREPVSGENSTAMNALKLWCHSWEVRDTTNLYSYSDKSGKEQLDRWGVAGTNAMLVDNVFRLSNTNSPIVTVLCQGAVSLRTNDYAFFFLRREHATDPTNHTVFFERHDFKRTEDGYLWTCDLGGCETLDPLAVLDLTLDLLNPSPTATNLFELLYPPYSHVYETLKDSSLPAHFYTIE